MKEGFVRIKVKPTGKMVMIQVDVMAKQINYIHLPEDVRYGEAIRRAKVLATGAECEKLKPGDTVYFSIGANCAEVEHFARTQMGDEDGGQVYLVHEDNIPAMYEIVEEDALDVVMGMSTEAHKKAQDTAVEMSLAKQNEGQPRARIYRPV